MLNERAWCNASTLAKIIPDTTLNPESRLLRTIWPCCICTIIDGPASDTEFFFRTQDFLLGCKLTKTKALKYFGKITRRKQEMAMSSANRRPASRFQVTVSIILAYANMWFWGTFDVAACRSIQMTALQKNSSSAIVTNSTEIFNCALMKFEAFFSPPSFALTAAESASRHWWFTLQPRQGCEHPSLQREIRRHSAVISASSCPPLHSSRHSGERG